MGKRIEGPSGVSWAVVLCLLLGLGACAPAPPPAQPIDDPYERENRSVHAFNKGVDRAVIRPLTSLGGGGDGPGLTAPVRVVLRNLGDTLEGPGRIVNNLLQGRIEEAGHNTFRLATNLTFGLGGVLDPATDMGLEARDTDFGETLHVWGADEGAYLEVPLLGPSTERDLIGDIVDSALNPLRHILPEGQRAQARGVRAAAKLAGRSRFGSTVDDVLYDSADSYAQLRLIYLQNRRFELARNARRAGRGGPESTGAPRANDAPYDSAADPTYIDPYEELYGQ